MRAATPSVERCTKRSVSRDSCPKAFTTRRAPSVSCTTASAELSSFLTCRDWRRMRGRYRRDSTNGGGDERNDPLDHDLVDHRRVLLNAIQRVGAALRVVIRQREALGVLHQLRAE